MQIFKKTPNIDFLKYQKITAIFSFLIIIAGLVGLFTKGMRLGIDFRGGTNVQVKINKEVEISEIRKLLIPTLGEETIITNFGEKNSGEFLIAIPKIEKSNEKNYIGSKIKEALLSNFPQLEIRRVESVGPKIGSELKQKAFYAILLALLGILIYITIRFEFIFAVGSIIALFHDVFIVITFFVLLGKEFNLIIIASLLTILGYSLNDTIVIFDRIREKKKQVERDIAELVNIGVNECLSRTILTSLTTLLVALMLYFLEVIF